MSIEPRVSNDEFSSLEVLRSGEAKFDSLNSLYKNEIFEGASNTFLFKRIYSLYLQCDFQLAFYPFDYQECFIDVGFKNVSIIRSANFVNSPSRLLNLVSYHSTFLLLIKLQAYFLLFDMYLGHTESK